MTRHEHPTLPRAALTAPSVRLMRASLVAVWLGTAVVSAITHRTQGEALLRSAGLTDDTWIQALIWGGAAADLLMGIALWRWPGRHSAWAALALMGVMTLTATVLLPFFNVPLKFWKVCCKASSPFPSFQVPSTLAGTIHNNAVHQLTHGSVDPSGCETVKVSSGFAFVTML